MAWFRLIVVLTLMCVGANGSFLQIFCPVCPKAPTPRECPSNPECKRELVCPKDTTIIEIPGIDTPTSCYATRLAKLNVLQAAGSCKNLGGYLAEFETSEELTAVTAGLSANREYTIGYTNAYNGAGDLQFVGKETGNAIALPADVINIQADTAKGCQFLTIQRSFGNVKTLKTQQCLESITYGGHICEIDISKLETKCRF